MENKPIRELVITRVFDAPLDVVWNAWTNEKQVQKWWGPMFVTNPVCIVEAKVGGKLEIVMLAGKELGPMAGQRWPMNGKFSEITPKKRIVFSSNAIDDKKEALLENTVTVDLENLQGKTGIKIKIVVTKAVAGKTEMMLQGMEMGWNQQTDKLAKFVANQK